jgi:hypothetical protein
MFAENPNMLRNAKGMGLLDSMPLSQPKTVACFITGFLQLH